MSRPRRLIWASGEVCGLKRRFAGEVRVPRPLRNSAPPEFASLIAALFPDKALRSLGRKVYLHIYLPISLRLSRSSSRPRSSPGTRFTVNIEDLPLTADPAPFSKRARELGGVELRGFISIFRPLLRDGALTY